MLVLCFNTSILFRHDSCLINRVDKVVLFLQKRLMMHDADALGVTMCHLMCAQENRRDQAGTDLSRLDLLQSLYAHNVWFNCKLGGLTWGNFCCTCIPAKCSLQARQSVQAGGRACTGQLEFKQRRQNLEIV